MADNDTKPAPVVTTNAQQGRHRLANQILDLIRHAKFEIGHHLREQQLGDMLGVSRTPVRAALNLLAERGIVETRKNQGFFLKAQQGMLHRTEVEVPTTADQDLYARIVEDRLSGILGDSITQVEITRRYKVDRTLLQRTLTHLVNDGLLSRNSGRGWTFRPTLDSQVALRDSYDYRSTLEPAGLLLGSFQFDRSLLERSRLEHLYLEGHPDISSVDPRQLFETDAQFHEMIAAFSGNIFFLQAIQQQNRLRRLLEFGGYSNRRRVRDWCREHLDIIDAIFEGNRVRASELMIDHLGAARASARHYPKAPPRS
ncbi:DNA-binding transcriptional regulator, GntR family [Rhizobium sp. NFR07]|uniref:GntR family transcriptional regulator n=1 Tax=Rhizobium sp. NFR07 TaxID=1566262 RepID=UPI0008E168CC|nr:GntR family transcriptional regulator [Rhizobium sp. NFR07]SFB34335.1 DNA-binding transcriptional regulator, GntR family [Rhizobium sp. NFR07]